MDVRVRSSRVSREDCLRVITAVAGTSGRTGGVLRSGTEVADVRLRACIEHALREDERRVVAAALEEVSREAVREIGVPNGILDGPKFCSYPAGGFFRAHRDRSEDTRDPLEVRSRVLSLVCFLNDADPAGDLPTFDGGTLVVHVPQSDGSVLPVNVIPSAGSIVIFPADLMHEVRPVRSGTRVAAVAWLFNPDTQCARRVANDGSV